MDEKRKKDLEDVMRTESRRGRRPIDLETRRKGGEKLQGMRTYLAIATEEEFVKAMLGVGLSEGSPEFLVALRIWREYRSSRRPDSGLSTSSHARMEAVSRGGRQSGQPVVRQPCLAARLVSCPP